MRFAVGYPVRPFPDDPFAEVVADYADSVSEVYFAWPGDASGRTASAGGRDAEQRLLADLRQFRESGINLDLLLNSACYGAQAISKTLAFRVRHTLDVIAKAVGAVDVVTTTSPAIAYVVRKHFPLIDVRASVNMRIGTVAGMSYLADLFDSFYVQRDYNRDLKRISKLHAWADRNGKRLCMLANSGCLRFCSSQSFHDNLVAHAQEADPDSEIDGFEPLACRRVIRDAGRVEEILKATWVRPEDIHRYRRWFDVVKLATRTHDSPRLVLDAYARGRFHGNLLDLLEPGYAAMIAPTILDNDRFPADWFERTTRCNGECNVSGYYKDVLERIHITGRP